MASTYLTRTGGTATDGKKFTYSAWFKRGNLGSGKELFCIYADNTNRLFLRNNGDTFELNLLGGFGSTTRQFRDPSAWYHFVIACDSTQATASDRGKWYLNGELIMTGSISLNQVFPHGQSTPNFIIGNGEYNNTVYTQYWDGSMAHVHFIDGTAYGPDTFGETDATTGIWKPITAPSVTYGNNGFFLKFENSGAFGTDSSGNSNTFTVNGTMTQTIDTPSNVFNLFNAIQESPANNSLTNGNTVSVNDGSASGHKLRVGTLGASQGKWYAEFKLTNGGSNYPWIGIMPFEDFNNPDDFLGNSQNSIGYSSNGQVYRNGSSLTSGLTSIGTNDIGMVAFDLDNNYVYFGVNGTWSNSGDPTSGGSGTGGFSITATGKTYTFAVSGFNTDATWQGNFGNGYFGTTAVSSAQNPDDGIGIFEYDVPTGYRALCTKSINAEEYS